MDNSHPLVVAVDMGYGHLRPALSLADRLGTEVLRADAPPLSDDSQVRTWRRVRRTYEAVSRLSQSRWFGHPFRRILETVTSISSLYPRRDQSRPGRAVKTLYRMIDKGLAAGIVDRLRETGVPLLTTFYAPAIAAERAGLENIFVVVTDSDIHRVWAPWDASSTRITYLVPSQRALRRLRAYGVPRHRIEYTGFPLPQSLTGGGSGHALRRNLAARLARLDPDGIFRRQWKHELRARLGSLFDSEEPREPPLLTFAVGGAGAQDGLVRNFLPGFRKLIESDRLRLALVAGVRPEVAERLETWTRDAGLGDHLGHAVRILFEPAFTGYYHAFNDLLAETDILWTKPSELVFYGALGIPIVFSWPVGGQERMNRRWLLERGAGLKQRDPRFAADWIVEWLREGVLAATAWSGFMHLPAFGTDRVIGAVRGG